jgi:hypothetical protein
LEVKLVGDGPIGAVGVAQQVIGCTAEQMVGGKDKAQPGKLLRIVELAQVELFIGVAAAAKSLKPDLDAVRHKHPARTGRIDSVIPAFILFDRWLPTRG